MMIELSTMLSCINTIILVGACVFYFKKNYTVLDNDTFQILADAYEELNSEEGESQEKAGGVGFFQEYLNDTNEEEEEE